MSKCLLCITSICGVTFRQVHRKVKVMVDLLTSTSQSNKSINGRAEQRKAKAEGKGKHWGAFLHSYTQPQIFFFFKTISYFFL